MNLIRIGLPGARSGRPWPGELSPGPPDPGIVRATGRSRRPRVPDRRPGNAGLGRPVPMGGGPDGDPRGRDGLPRAGVHVGMHPAHQRGWRR
jgi:hypothetical protein